MLKVPPVVSGNLILLITVGLIAGSPLCGFLSDFWFQTRKAPIAIGLFGMAACLLILSYQREGANLILLSALFLLFGISGSTGQIMYAHIKERMPLEQAGTAMTGINFFTMMGVAFFMQLLGGVMQYIYPEASLGADAFKTAFSMCAVFLGVTMTLYLFTGESR